MIGASLMFMLGLSPFIGISYALVVAFFVYFGIKIFVGRRRRQLLEATGDGLCANCGAQLHDKRCLNCNNNNNDTKNTKS